jgi:hypothetical protein
MGKTHVALLRVVIAAMVVVCAVPAFAGDPEDDALAFNPGVYKTLSITLDGAPMQVRHYRVVYVAKPIKMAAMQPATRGGPDTPLPDVYSYQSMNIYVPESAYNNNKTAIILQVNNGGWFTSPAADRIVDGGKYVGTNDTDNTGAALKAGYVVINAGTRSRGAKAADGSWAGKAPAVIVDTKAAIRYLRLNDAVMPGSAERIVITGTSGGGGQSVSVAASGNSPDYFPYLAEVGAAGIDADGKSSIRDDVFATVAYCPINDLGHSDIAYEWQYSAVRTDANTSGGKYPVDMQKASKEYAAAYPAFLAGLGLKMEDGTPLTAETMDNAIIAQVKRDIYEALTEGAVIPAFGTDFVVATRSGEVKVKNEWLAIESGKITKFDYKNYLKFVTTITALKTVVAFDSTAVTSNKAVSGENTLFGPANIDYSNYTEWAWNNNEKAGDGTGLDDTGKRWALYIADPATIVDDQIKMVSPLPYLNTAADAAQYWYVRHGVIDRDTSFATQITLYYAILNDPSVKDLNFELAWLQGHGGNYDVREAYAWVAGVLAKAGDPAPRAGW